MRKAVFPTALAVVLSIALLAAEEPKLRPMTVDDGLNMVNVGEGLMSPDGKWVLFSKSELDWAANKRKTTHYMVPAEGGEAYQYIGEAGGSSFAFSPDGKFLSFLRAVDKVQQVFLMPTSGGEAVQLTKHASNVRSVKWTADSSALFFLAPEPRSKEDEKKYKDGEDALFVDEGPNGQAEGSWTNLWQFDLEAKKETKVSDEKWTIGSYDVAPDGDRVVLTARFEGRRNQGYLAEIYLLSVRAKTKTRLTDNKAPEGNPVWAPDGKTFAYGAPDDRVWELRNSKIWVMDPETKQHRLVSGAFEGSTSSIVWTLDSRSLLFNGHQRTDSNLFKLDIATGAVVKLTSVTGSLNVASYSRDRTRMAYFFSDLSTPGDLYVSSTETFQPVRLTDANPWVKKDILLARAEVIRWKSKDGLEVEGLLIVPAGHKEGTRLPLMLNIHGGPAGNFGNRFSAIYHIYAGLGYAALCPNVRGSSGYSDALLRGNMRDIGGGDYWDLMTGVDQVIKLGIADPNRLALRGWSYGGILGGWTITQTNRFKAASVGAMVSDWTSEYGPGFNHDVRLWYIGGTPWENPKAYRERSALTYAKNVTTPTIILHGANDTTDTEAQSMNFFAYLKDMGKTVRYLKFPREPHGLGEPRHQRTRDIEEIRWMQKYVLGLEWTPWVRPEDVKKDEKPEEKK